MPPTRVIAIAGAALTIAALLLQYWLQFQWMPPETTPLAVTWRYFGYFTILTNGLVVTVWMPNALGRSGSRFNTPMMEGLALTNIAMVGIIYHALLAARWHPEGAQWVADFVVHTVSPLMFAVYWCARPHGALRWRNAVVFALWPLAYCMYALIRGAFDGWYAYFFLDPSTTPLPQLALNILAQGAGFLLAGLVVVAFDRALARRFSRSLQPNASAPAP
ncbi:MAG: Pr6Pr family membrane protein [Terricaulis sp.]